jgi:predicted metal-dependent HD superfamily phosphohydrolase
LEPTPRQALDEAWHALRPDDPELGRDLLRRWREPHRRYHTDRHLQYMLEVIDRHQDLADDLDAVRMAAWLHDAVYDPRASDNEERSAALTGDPEVRRLVLLTKTHDPRPGDRNGELLCDADLAILAADPAAYREYAGNVREEYAFVPEDAFREGRGRILQDLLAKERLFRIVPEKEQWTRRARENMEDELRTVTGAA